MTDKKTPDEALDGIDDNKRRTLTRLALGAAFGTPIVASFSIDGLTISKVAVTMRNPSMAQALSCCSLPYSAMTTLSARYDATLAALIVCDESEFIEPCLQSLAGIVDDIVVVDTGSTDDTIFEKARRFPIELHEFAWRDDFSAARNYAIEQARGDWIFYIDADERLEVPDPCCIAWRLSPTKARLAGDCGFIRAWVGRPTQSCVCSAIICVFASKASFTRICRTASTKSAETTKPDNRHVQRRAASCRL